MLSSSEVELAKKAASGTELIKLESFDDNNTLQNRVKGGLVTSLTTVRFVDLDHYYQRRHAGTLPLNTVKPVYGQLLEFADIDHFVAGIPTGSHPIRITLDNEFTGVVEVGDELLACNKNHIEVFDGEFKRRIEHPLFNDLRFLDFNAKKRRLLVCSSGTESLLEFTYPEMELQWSWFAPEHGYDTAPDGTMIATRKMGLGEKSKNGLRVLDDGTDYSKAVIETTSQSSHVNSCCYLDTEGALVSTTLYQGGEVLLIDRNKEITRKVMTGLSRPHGFFPIEGQSGYVVTSAKSGLIDVLDADFQHQSRITGEIKRYDAPMTWIQNTFPLGEGVVASIDHYQRRVTLIDLQTREKQMLDTHNQWKIFQIYNTRSSRAFLSA